MLNCRAGLVAVMAFLGALASPAGADNALALAPGMAPLPAPGVPLLWAGLPDADRSAPDLRLTPARPYEWVAEAGQSLQVTASCATPQRRAVLTVWDWNRSPVAQRTFSTPCSEPVSFAVAGRGTYLLTLDLFRGEECLARLARSFSVCPSNLPRRAAWRQGPFRVGCCSFPGRQNWSNEFGPAHPADLTEAQSREREADLSARLGMVLVRPDLSVFWPARDKPMDFALADLCMNCYTDRGFDLALQMGFPYETDWTLMPRYAAVTDPKWRYPRTESVVRAFSQAVAERYGRSSAWIELYNEPDNRDFWRGTVDEFISTHRWMAESVRRACPQVSILSGGLCLMEPERTGLIARGIRDRVDGVGYHSHGGVDVLAAAFTAMRAVHAAAGYAEPAFYNTEMGYANWRLDMERASAATAVQKLLYCWAHGNRAALLYCSRELGGPRPVAGDWGYLDNTFCPRFSFGAVAAFMDRYAGATCEAILTESNGLHVYRFRAGERLLVPYFVAQDFPRPLALETDAAGAWLLDPMGNSAPQEITGGKLKLTADLYPQTVVLEGAGRVTVQG